jgi:imidazolonepropionase-like amidohydrolase
VLWMMPVAPDGTPTGDPVRLTDELAESPSWTGDSQHIAYMSVDRVRSISLIDSGIETVMTGPEFTRAEAPGRTVVHAGGLWDGRSDAAQHDVDIVVEGRRISSVQPHDAALHSEGVVDASDGFVIPGLVEMHGHQSDAFGEGLGRELLAYGVTTIREPASDPYEAINRREATEAGVRTGPRVFTTGYMLDGSRIYYDLGQAIEPGPQLDRELDRVDKLDYDLVKTYVRFPDAMQKRVIERAHELGIWVTSHEVYPSVANGGDGVEHIQGTSRRGYSPKVSRGAMRTYQDIVELLAASGMAITPTMSLQGGFYWLVGQDPSRMDDERLRILYPAPSGGAAAGGRGGRGGGSGPNLRVQNQQRFVTELVRKGGRVVAGTDTPIIPFGVSLHAELELFVGGGLTPVEALRAATVVSAEALGAADDLGAVAAGMLADFVILDANPLEDIENTRRVRAVVADGRLHTVADLVRGPRR